MEELIIKNLKDIDFSSKKKFLKSYIENEAPATYYKDNPHTIQCAAGKNRSMLDLYRLLNGMFKTPTSINTTVYLLLSLIKDYCDYLDEYYDEEILDKGVCALYCSDIEKIVFYIDMDPCLELSDIDSIDSEEVIDGYSWDTLVEIYNKMT